MEELINISLLIAPLLALTIPVISKLKYFGVSLKSFFLYMATNGLVISLILLASAWWGYASLEIKLVLLNLNLEGHNDQSRLANVQEADKAHALNLYYSQFGIGWPLKAIFASVLTIPYYLVIFLLHLAYVKYKKCNKRKHNRTANCSRLLVLLRHFMPKAIINCQPVLRALGIRR
jgi:hypothetical protein